MLVQWASSYVPALIHSLKLVHYLPVYTYTNHTITSASMTVTSQKLISWTTSLRCYNFYCHNIYWDPLIWLVKNGHLIVLTCISFFNELPSVFMRGGDIHYRTSFVILCDASMKRNGQSATTITLIFSRQRLTYIRRLKGHWRFGPYTPIFLIPRTLLLSF